LVEILIIRPTPAARPGERAVELGEIEMPLAVDQRREITKIR
jgi:hypothetical protein